MLDILPEAYLFPFLNEFGMDHHVRMYVLDFYFHLKRGSKVAWNK